MIVTFGERCSCLPSWTLMITRLKFYLIALFVIASTCRLFAQTWSPPIRVSLYDTTVNWYNVLYHGFTVDGSGIPWCGWSMDCYAASWSHGIFVSYYSDTAWSIPDTIYPFSFFIGCELATDASGKIWVVAEDVGISACFYNGNSWSGLMQVPTQGSCCHYPVATGDSLANLWACWAGGGPGDGHHIWGNAYSAGQWGSPILISYPGSPEELTYSMTTDIQGRVWVGWYRFSCPDRAICVSFNDGSGWSDTMMVAGYPHSYFTIGPALTVDTSGKIWAGWLGCDSIENWKVYASYFEDSVWSYPMLISESAAWGDYPVAITSDERGNVWLVWVNPDENIYYSYWNGIDWSEPVPIDTHPAPDYCVKMTFDGEKIWVTWIREIDSNLYGVYASYTYGVGVEEQTINPLHSGSVSCQISPNPFTSNTIIYYQLPSDRYVTLTIYNITGELVRTLVSKPQVAGHHAVRWNGQDDVGTQLPAGIYFQRLETSNRCTTRKIVKLE